MRKKIMVGCLAAVLLLSGCGRETEKETLQTVEVEYTAPVMEDEKPEEPEVDLHPYDFTLAFAGDINLAENWNTMDYYRQQDNGIYDCIDPTLIQMMQEADLTCLNMEFCLSSVGSPMEGKAYTFRADPYRVQILNELSVDVVNLANNHVYDYGKDAFLDMLSLLKDFSIPYMGAGKDAREAEAPYYIELDGKKIAIVAATRAEKYILTPEATEDSPGVFRCYDRTRLLEVVQEADANADYVIAYIHWGTEYSEVLEEAQTEGARDLVKAGADVVLGAHPHCLQGAEYIDGVPVLYSLGNYWFNEKTLDSILVKLHFYGDDEEQHLDTILVPARQEDHYTRLLIDPEEIQKWNEHLIQMSPGAIQIDEEGRLKSTDMAE
ncbi:MAG: CapA family protein [Lachnospiraceae bacterium]|nr:CapA family protein [Lachnospiraceae bacterium]